MKKKISIVTTLIIISFSVLAQADNTYWLPGAGINSMSFAPNCSLGQLFVEVEYNDVNGDIDARKGLYFRKRNSSGGWQAVEPVKEEWVMDWVTEDAALFYVSRGSLSNWEAYALEEDDYGDKSITRYLRDAAGNWTQPHSSESFAEAASFASAMSTDNTMHFAVLGDSMLRYITFDGASFVTETVASYSNLTLMSGFATPHSFRLRNLSMAVDSLGIPHIVYSVDQVSTSVPGGTLQTSKLFYATKPGNDWTIATLIDQGLSDDAGLGASIAVAPNGTIAVASSYLPRAGTGSPGVCQLRYLYKTGAGTWVSQIVAQQSDGYRSGDGERGTGLYPYLQFDGASKPHIIFTDHASEHTNTAWSYSGQLRYVTRSSAASGTWQLQTVVQQSTNDAFLKRLDYSAIAASSGTCGNRVAVYTIKEEYTENPFFYYNFTDIFKWVSGAEPPPPPPPPENEGKSMPWLFLLLN